MLRRVFNVVAVMRKVTVFDVAKSDGEDFDKAILDTVTNNLRPLLSAKTKTSTVDLESIRQKGGIVGGGTMNEERKKQLKLGAEYELYMDVLRLALTFDRVDEAKVMLVSARETWDRMKFDADDLPAASEYKKRIQSVAHARTGYTAMEKVVEVADGLKTLYGLTYQNQAFDIQMPLALLWAMQENCVEQVDLIISKGGVDIVWFLYGTPTGLDQPSSASIGEYYRGYMLAQLYDYSDDDARTEYLKPLLQFEKIDRGTEPKDSKARLTRAEKRMERVWNLQVQLLEDDSDEKDGVRKLKGMWDEALALRTDSTRAGLEDLLAYQELMMWACITQRYEMARLFWKLGGHAIPNALLASMICKQLAGRDELKEGKYAVTKRVYERMQVDFERCACDVLNLCYAADTDKTQAALEAQLSSYKWLVPTADDRKSCLELAKDAKSQKFIGQAACQAVIERKWNGLVPPLSRNDLVRISDDRNGLIKALPFVDKFNNLAPKLKYRAELASFVALIILYSYFALAKLEDKVTTVEWVLFAWFTGLLIEEVRQTGEEGGDPRKALREWFADKYNKLDLAMYFFFFLAFSFRYSDREFLVNHYQGKHNQLRVAKGMHGVNILLVYFRLLSYMKTHPQIGPKIKIFEELFAVLIQFLVLLFVFIISYGIFVQTVAAPFAESETLTDWGVLLWRVWYRPYFQMYGELMLDDLADDSSCNAPGYPWVSCGNSIDAAVPIVTALYLIVTSIMLLNMLIAAFTTTYERIEAKAEAFYREEKLDLLDQYEDRLPVPAPFNFPFIVWMGMERVYNKLSSVCGEPDVPLPVVLSESDKGIEAFQDDIADRYAEDPPDINDDESLEVKLDLINQKLLKQMSAMKADAEMHFNFLKGRMLSENIRSEKKVEVEIKLGLPASELFDAGAESLQQWEEYSLSNRINLVAFRAESITQDIAKKAVVGATQSTLPAADYLNPASKTNPIEFPTSPPSSMAIQNKSERLKLQLKGENRMLMHFVTRWKRDDDGIRMERGGMPVLEFIAIKRHRDDEQWAIPEALYDVTGSNTDQFGAEYSTEDPPSPVQK